MSAGSPERPPGLPPPVAASGPYELYKNDHGLGIRITQKLPAGALVLSDTPLFELPQALFSNTPAVIKEVLKIALKEATAEEKRSFLSLSNAYRGIPWNEMKEEDGIQTPRDPLSGIFLSNCLDTNPTDGILGVFPIASRLNHSCTPNSMTSYSASRKVLSLFTLVPLPAGSELLIAYMNIALPIATRQARLFQRYQFYCRCSTCALTFGPGVEEDNAGTGSDPKAAKASEHRRRRITVLRQIMSSWAEHKVRGTTVLQLANEVLGPGGVLDVEGLVVLKADLWRDVCAIAAAHSSISRTRSAATEAYETYVLEAGSTSPQALYFQRIVKDPRKHEMFGRREYVDFDAPAEQGIDWEELGLDNDGVMSVEALTTVDGKKKKKKKKKKKEKGSKLEPGLDGSGGEDDAEEAFVDQTTETATSPEQT